METPTRRLTAARLVLRREATDLELDAIHGLPMPDAVGSRPLSDELRGWAARTSLGDTDWSQLHALIDRMARACTIHHLCQSRRDADRYARIFGALVELRDGLQGLTQDNARPAWDLRPRAVDADTRTRIERLARELLGEEV